MKNIQEILENRRSVRQFTGKAVNKEDLELIMKLALRMPNTRGMQLVSFVVIDDKEKIEKIAKYCGNQKQVASADVFVVVVADFNKLIKATNTKIEINSKMALVDMAIDCGIAVSTIELLSSSFSYGSTIIGGVNSVDPNSIIELLKLPKYTFPMIGITIGVPTDEAISSEIKPRVKYDQAVFFNEYCEQKAIEGVKMYDDTLNSWFEKKSLNMPRHLDVIGKYLNGLSEDKILEIFRKQGL